MRIALCAADALLRPIQVRLAALVTVTLSTSAAMSTNLVLRIGIGAKVGETSSLTDNAFRHGNLRTVII